MRVHGRASEVEIESPLAYIVELRNGKAYLVRAYLDHNEALEAAGLRE